MSALIVCPGATDVPLPDDDGFSILTTLIAPLDRFSILLMAVTPTGNSPLSLFRAREFNEAIDEPAGAPRPFPWPSSGQRQGAHRRPGPRLAAGGASWP